MGTRGLPAEDVGLWAGVPVWECEEGAPSQGWSRGGEKRGMGHHLFS